MTDSLTRSLTHSFTVSSHKSVGESRERSLVDVSECACTFQKLAVVDDFDYWNFWEVDLIYMVIWWETVV